MCKESPIPAVPFHGSRSFLTLRAGRAIWVGNGGVEAAERGAVCAEAVARGSGSGSRRRRAAMVARRPVLPILPTATLSRLRQSLSLSSCFCGTQRSRDGLSKGRRKSSPTGGASPEKHSVWVGYSSLNLMGLSEFDPCAAL